MNLTETERAKVQQLMMDPITPRAIYKVLLTSFLKKKVGEDTHMKAARFVATELLEDAWKILESYQVENENNGSMTRQIGL